MKQKKSGKIGKGRMALLVAAAVVILIIVIRIATKGGNEIEVTASYPCITSIEQSIPANGKIQPVTEVKISPDVSGEIVELNVKEGDKVKAGDLLIKIKQDVYLSAVERSEATLNSTRAQYKQQKAQMAQYESAYQRASRLYEKKAIAKSEYESALAQYEAGAEQLKACEYNISSYKAALKEARENLLKTTIYAPVDGTVSKLSVEKGERVVGTGQMAGTEMLRIADLGNMEVLVDVNENDIVKLSLQDSAQVEVDAYPGRKFKGTVTQIASSSKGSGTTTTDQVTNFEVKIRIIPDSYSDLEAGGNVPLRPGMSASVNIITARHENALVIPLQSVTTRKGLVDSLNYEGNVWQQVFVVDTVAGTVEVRVVKTGIQDILSIEVISGLNAKEKIVTAPFNAIAEKLVSGSAVKVK